MVTSHWGCRVSWLLPKKREKEDIYQNEEEKSKGKAGLILYNFVFFYPFQG